MLKVFIATTQMFSPHNSADVLALKEEFWIHMGLLLVNTVLKSWKRNILIKDSCPKYLEASAQREHLRCCSK